jgi:hypothetical protein
VLLALLVNTLLEGVGSAAILSALINNTGCLDTTRCSRDYVYGWYGSILILTFISFLLTMVLAWYVQFKVTWDNKCEELAAENDDKDEKKEKK